MNGLLLNNLKSASEVFRDEGVLLYPRLFAGAEIERLRAACEYVRDGFLSYVDVNHPPKSDPISTRALEEPFWHPDTQEHRLRIMETAADPRCLGPVEQIFGEPSLFRSTSLFFNPLYESRAGDWHRDIQFLVPDEEQVKAWLSRPNDDAIQLQIALIDNDDIEFVPFSPGRYDSPEEYYIRCADQRQHSRESGMPNAMRIPQRAGDALIFNPSGLHRGRYLVDNPRLTLMLTYTRRSWPYRDDFSYQPWLLEPGALAGLSPRARVYFEEFIGVYRDFWQTEHRAPAFR